jgi:hypothetical protein
MLERRESGRMGDESISSILRSYSVNSIVDIIVSQLMTSINIQTQKFNLQACAVGVSWYRETWSFRYTSVKFRSEESFYHNLCHKEGRIKKLEAIQPSK